MPLSTSLEFSEVRIGSRIVNTFAFNLDNYRPLKIWMYQC